MSLIELLVVVVIIAILAAATWGGLQKVTLVAREAHTKATIAKIDHFILMKLESYKTRRVPIDTSTDNNVVDAATIRLHAIRDLMRMEMPDCAGDISGPLVNRLPQPALCLLYQAKGTPTSSDSNNSNAIISAKCLFLTVMTGNAEAREQFQENEFTVDKDGFGMFIDGWKRPIAWVRWPVGFIAPASDIQSGNATTDHDPFDPLNVDQSAFQLTPLIVSSAGHTKPTSGSGNAYDYGVTLETSSTTPTVTPFGNTNVGALTGAIPIHNHHIEQR